MWTNNYDFDMCYLLEKMNENKVKKEQKTTQICQICKTDEYIEEDYTGGILVCKKCGYVQSFILDFNSEQKHFEDESKGELSMSTMLMNTMLPQSALGTNMAGFNKSRIKTIHSWSIMPYKERSLNLVLKEIQTRCNNYNILKCIEDDAKIMYKNISECKHIMGKNRGKNIIIRGVNRKSLIAACVFFACKKKGKTRSPKEIANIFGLKFTEITKGCKTFIKLIRLSQTVMNISASAPEHFVTRFCEELKISKKYSDDAMRIAHNIQKLNIASVHTPLTIATGSIYMMILINNLDVSKKIIAQKFNVSEVTITKAYKKIEPYKKALISNEITDKIIKILENKNNKLPEHLQKRLDNFMSIPRENDDDIIIYDSFNYAFEIENSKINNVFFSYYENVKIDNCKMNNDLSACFENIDIELYNTLNDTDELYYNLLNHEKD